MKDKPEPKERICTSCGEVFMAKVRRSHGRYCWMAQCPACYRAAARRNYQRIKKDKPLLPKAERPPTEYAIANASGRSSCTSCPRLEECRQNVRENKGILCEPDVNKYPRPYAGRTWVMPGSEYEYCWEVT